MNKKLSSTEFLEHVASHEMQIICEDGLYRHIRFKRPGTSNMYFDLVTIPGMLTYTGDMGTYVFERLEDMFKFFRTERTKDGDLRINEGYWAQKLVACACNGKHAGSVRNFCFDRFKQTVIEYIRNSDAPHRASILKAVREEVFRIAEGDTTGVRAYDAITDFEYDDFRFQDFFEYDCTDWDYGFTWCCFAISWGVEQYDKSKVTP